MRKNRIKTIIDLSTIILLILTTAMPTLTLSLIFFALFILLIIVDRFFWKCRVCGNQLPNKTWFNTVKCCPYCKTDIEEI